VDQRDDERDGRVRRAVLHRDKVLMMLGQPLPEADCKKNQVKAETSLAPQYAVNWPRGTTGCPIIIRSSSSHRWR
jgi:hypothetical protein